MNFKKTTALLMAGLLSAGLLAGCGGDNGGATTPPAGSSGGSSTPPAGSSTPAPSNDKLENITLVLSQRDEWLSLMDGAAKDAAEPLGFKINSVDALSDSNKQLQFVETARNNGERAIIVNLVDPNIAGDVVEAAGDMKVVFVNRPPQDMGLLNENVVYIGSDETTSGAFQGEWLAKYFKDKNKTDIKYIMLNGILGQVSTTNRTASVLKSLADNGINATEATAPLAGKFDRAEAMNLISPLLSSGLEYDCVISNNDAMALGVIEAMEQQSIDPAEKPIVGIDASPDGRAAVKSGKLAMSVFQDAKGQGRGALQVAVNMLNGKPLNDGMDYQIAADNANVIWVPFEPVTAENVASYDNR